MGQNSSAAPFPLRHGFAAFGRSGVRAFGRSDVKSLGFGIHSSVFKGPPAKPCKLWGSGCAMKKLQKGAWPQKPVLPAKAARACFRRFFAAPTPSAALASQLGKFPRAKRQPATRASSPRSNASPPTWNASPSLSPTKQPESQVFQIARIKSQATTRMQPYSARTASQIYRTALHKYGTIYRGICVSSY